MRLGQEALEQRKVVGGEGSTDHNILYQLYKLSHPVLCDHECTSFVYQKGYDELATVANAEGI